MRFSTAISILSLGAVASASALPNVLSPYDLATPVVEREVPTLKCETKPVHQGLLKLVSQSGRETTAAFEGIRNSEGLQILDVGKGGQSAREESFSFTSCNSTFMRYETEYTKAAEVFYGRLQPTNFPKRCVSASSLGSGNARLVSDVCSNSDDSGQLLEFWTLTKQPSPDGNDFTYYLSFPGVPAGNDPDFKGSYLFSKTVKDNNKLVKLSYNEAEGATSPYYFKLS